MNKSLYAPEYKRFRELLRKLRTEKDLTQEDVAGALGKRQSFIQKCESGERRVDIVELDTICEILGVSLQDFIAMFKGKSGNQY